MEKVKCIITNKGRELLNKCQAEKVAMEFTSLKSGSGFYDEFEDLRSRTGLKEYKQTFDNFYVSREGEETIIRSVLSNEHMTESYKLREIGIWAKEKDADDEILYAISVTLDDEVADLIFPKKGNYSTSLEYNHYFKISESVEVYINVDSNNILSRMYIEFDKLRKEYLNDLKELKDGLDELGKIPLLKQEIRKIEARTDINAIEIKNLRAEMEAFKKSLINNMDKNIFVENFENLDDVEIISGIYNESAMKIYV